VNYQVACVQMTSSSHIAENLSQAKMYIEQAAQRGAKLIILPEMFCLMGMDRMDKIKQKEKLGRGPIQDFLHEQAIKNQVWIVGGTIPIEVPHTQDKAYAACLLYNDKGHCVAHYNKIHLFDVEVKDEIHFESESIYPGQEVIVYPTPFGKLGLAVCYDVRFPELFRQMSEKGVEIIALPSAFTYTTGSAHWEVLVRARAIENQVYLLAACQFGTHENSRKTFGHSMIVNPWGEVQICLASGDGLITGEIDLDYLYQLRKKFPALEHRRLV
jgi:nitrilase